MPQMRAFHDKLSDRGATLLLKRRLKVSHSALDSLIGQSLALILSINILACSLSFFVIVQTF